jgi:methyl-accepting chemotaxis protein
MQSSSAIKKNAQGFLSEYATTIACDIEAFFERSTGLVEAASFFPGLAQMTWWEKKQALDSLGTKLTQSHSIHIYLYCNPDGSYYRSDNPGNPDLGGLVTADNSNPTAAPTFLNTRDYFTYLVGANTAREHRTYVSNPILSKSTGQKFVMVGSSVIDQSSESGAVAGLLGIYIEDRNMREILDALTTQIRNNFGEQLIFLIFSENDTILSHREFDPVQGEYTERALNMNEDIAIDSLPVRLRQAAKDLITGSSLSYQEEDGSKYFITSASVEGTGYRVVLALPEPILYGTIMNIERITLIILVVTIIVVFFFSFFLSDRITGPIIKTVSTLKDISEGEGDLTKTVSVTSNDEIGELAHYFNATLNKVKSLVITIKNQATILFDIGTELAANMAESAASINEITANIHSISDQIVNQKTLVTETNTEIEQIGGNIEQLSGHVEDQSANVSRSSSAVEQMLASIQSVTQTLVKNAANVTQLREASDVGRAGLEEVAMDIQEIARESAGILEINAVMENIASQTNLLSMNAAIEAAHAGEAGKGFAVVADEIRKLAEDSAEQSKTITSVLKKIKDCIDKITKSTESVLNKFEAIDSDVKTVSEQQEDIRNAMEEQGVGSKQILEAIGRLNDATQLVKDGSVKMLKGSERVIQEGKNLGLITVEIADGMNEMAIGAEQINVAVSRVNTISGQNKENIDVLVREVLKFKV